MIRLFSRLMAPLRRGIFFGRVSSRIPSSDKFLITAHSENVKTGPIVVTTSPRRSCPHSCPLKRTAGSARAGACHAEHGYVGGYIWTMLGRTPAGGAFQNGNIHVHAFDDLLDAIHKLPAGSLWRHNQAGDLVSDDQRHIDRSKLLAIVKANKGRRGFTFTHFDPIEFPGNKKPVLDANRAGFTINLSGNASAHPDRLADLGIAPVTTLLPSNAMTTPRRRRDGAS